MCVCIIYEDLDSSFESTIYIHPLFKVILEGSEWNPMLLFVFQNMLYIYCWWVWRIVVILYSFISSKKRGIFFFGKQAQV